MSSLEVGIVGLPNVGKSTLFNAITKAGAEAANYPFCTIEPNVGVVAVPDNRLKFLRNFTILRRRHLRAFALSILRGLSRARRRARGLAINFLNIFGRLTRLPMLYAVLRTKILRTLPTRLIRSAILTRFKRNFALPIWTLWKSDLLRLQSF